MGRLRFFYLAVLLTGALLEVEAQESFVDRLKNFFQTLADDIQMKFDEFKTAMGDKFGSLSEKLKNFFNNRDFSSATAADLVAELKGDDWKKLEPSMLMTMPKVEAEKLVTLGVAKDIPPRFLSELKRLMIVNMTDAELAVSVKTKLPMLNADEISTLLQRLGPVNTWTSANISSFGTYILKVPVCFDDANDEKVLQNVLDLVNNCDTSSPPTGCPSRSQLDYIRLPVTMKLSGAPKNWKMSDVEKMMPTYTDIPSFTIRSTSDSFVQDMKAKLKAAQNLPTDSSPELEAWMTEICRVDGCSSMSATEATAWYNGLGSMKTAVTPSDVSQAAREDAKLSVQLEANAKAKVPMRAMDAAILLDMKLNKEQPDSITNIGGKMAVWAPACYLWGAAENKTLSSVMTDVTSRLGSQQGPEHMAKVNAALKSTMEQALTNNGGFKMSVVNNYLKPYILSDYLEEQSSSTVLSVVKLADANNIQPNPYQMHAMIKKISATDSQESPAALKERLPVSFMASVSNSVLARLDEGMMGVTLPCLLGAKKMFTSKTSLQPTDIANGKAFLKCMSFDDASKVDSSEIFEIFEEVLDEDMSWSACRAFDEKLTEWAKNNLNIGDSENLEDVVNRLYLHEIYKIPACVMIAYEPVIYKTNNQVKKAVMNNLCSARNYFSIPRDARRRVVNTLLPQTMDGPITVCGMRRINFCFVDLNSNMLQKMDEGATASYISLLEEFLKRRIPLCLDSGQRDEVAEMVLQMKGPAATWKTASDVSCILDTLSSSGIDRIAADMPAEVLITTECPKRDDTFRSMPLQGNCKREVEEARMRMKNRKVERCVRLRETFGTNNGTCDSVMCGNILRMTSSQLERMNKQEVVRLLDSLATEDVDTAKAKVVLAKVKEVKPLKDMSVTELQRLKYAWRGLSKQDVENLPTLTSAHREVIFQLGMTTGLPDDVMIALRDKIIQDYKPPSSMDDTDVFLLGGLVCYLTQDQVNAIPDQVFKRSMRNLGVRECKNATTTYHLATKAVAAYGKSPSNWDAAMVHESGVLVAGLRPEELAVIPHQAYIGFTSSGISKIDTEAIKVMTVAQASNLDGPTAAAITSSQIEVLDSNVQLAITNANSEELGNGASDVSVPRVLVAVATVLLLFLH